MNKREKGEFVAEFSLFSIQDNTSNLLTFIVLTINPKYITDQKGKNLSVVLSIEEFESMVEHLEELEDV